MHPCLQKLYHPLFNISPFAVRPLVYFGVQAVIFLRKDGSEVNRSYGNRTLVIDFHYFLQHNLKHTPRISKKQCMLNQMMREEEMRKRRPTFCTWKIYTPTPMTGRGERGKDMKTGTKKYKNEKWGSIKTESAETESLQGGRFLLMREAQECGEPRWTAGPRVTDPRTQVHWRFTEDPGYQAFSHGSFRLVSVTKSRAGAVLSLSSHCVSKTAELSLVTNNRPLTHPATKNQNIV